MIEPRYFSLSVTKSQHSATLNCKAYYKDPLRTIRAFEFSQLLSSFPRTPLPVGRDATLPEELRATDYAVLTSKNRAVPDEVEITIALRDTYGPDALIRVSTI